MSSLSGISNNGLQKPHELFCQTCFGSNEQSSQKAWSRESLYMGHSDASLRSLATGGRRNAAILPIFLRSCETNFVD